MKLIIFHEKLEGSNATKTKAIFPGPKHLKLKAFDFRGKALPMEDSLRWTLLLAEQRAYATGNFVGRLTSEGMTVLDEEGNVLKLSKEAYERVDCVNYDVTYEEIYQSVVMETPDGAFLLRWWCQPLYIGESVKMRS